MSRTLARQKLEAAISAMRCAQSNIDEAAAQLTAGEVEDRLAIALCNAMSLSVEEFIRAARETHDAINPVLDAH